MQWTKCSDQLPEDGTLCWICDKDKEIYGALFRKEQKRNNWSPLRYYTTIEPVFETNESNEHFVFLDDALYWMPYFTPEIPENFEYENPYKDWIKCSDRLPDFKQSCEFVVHRCRLIGMHGKNGMFLGTYTNEQGECCANCTYSNVSYWKPLSNSIA